MDRRPVTRLAPSPTGALHLGNVRTFLINHAMAIRGGWRCVLRIEDLDSPRIKPGVIELTIDLLRWLGITWDGPPIIQSTQRGLHEAAMHMLASRECIYPCDLTRKEIDAAASAPQDGSNEVVFPAHLRPALIPRTFIDSHSSWRYITPDGNVTFEDEFAGICDVSPSQTIGDFIVWTRRDPGTPDQVKLGQAAYQLAVVVDDAQAGVTHIVRGDDLIESAGRQILLYRSLGLGPHPTYYHLPLVVGEDGKRLAKRHGDTRLDVYRAAGVTREQIIGLIAFWCGMVPQPREMGLDAFIARLDITTVPRTPVIFTQDHHRFLLGTR